MSSAGGCPSWQAVLSVGTSIVRPGPCPPPADTPDPSVIVTTPQVTASIHDFAGSLANDRRHRAMSGHIQRLSLKLNGTSGHARRHRTTLRQCLLSSRSRVRVAVGAQVRGLDLIWIAVQPGLVLAHAT